MRRSLDIATLSFVLILLALYVTTASAQAPTPPGGIADDQVNAIAKQLYCPVCENIPLDVCPTQACTQWRELIREKLALGWDEQQIKDYFALQYGDRVLAEPPRRGLNWLVYVLPPITLLAGGVLLYMVLRPRASASRKASPAEAQAFDSSPNGLASAPGQPEKTAGAQGANPPVSDDYIRRIEEELRRREQ